MTLSNEEFIFQLVNGNHEAAVRQALTEAPQLARGSDGTLGTTALHCASHRGFTGIVAALLDAGADVHARERVSDSTALHWAAEGGHPTIARMLVDRGAAIDEHARDRGMAALRRPVQRGGIADPLSRVHVRARVEQRGDDAGEPAVAGAVQRRRAQRAVGSARELRRFGERLPHRGLVVAIDQLENELFVAQGHARVLPASTSSGNHSQPV